MHKPLPSFLITRTSTVYSKVLGLIKPLPIILLIYTFIAFIFILVKLYIYSLSILLLVSIL